MIADWFRKTFTFLDLCLLAEFFAKGPVASGLWSIEGACFSVHGVPGRVLHFTKGPCMTGKVLPSDQIPALLDVRRVAELLGCSPRHVYRLADSGRMPSPVKLGDLARWNRAALEAWIAGGCRPVRCMKGADR